MPGDSEAEPALNLVFFLEVEVKEFSREQGVKGPQSPRTAALGKCTAIYLSWAWA